MERPGFYRTLHGTPPPADQPRCVVCADISSGVHYGVNSCEGCKGFFRRCMVKGMNQQCTNNESCEITRFARNSCQFCRLKKCIEKGMSRSASKVGRRPKTQPVASADVKGAHESGPSKAGQRLAGHRRSQSLTPNNPPHVHSEPPSTRASPFASACSSPSLRRQSLTGAYHDQPFQQSQSALQEQASQFAIAAACTGGWRYGPSAAGVLSYVVDPPLPSPYIQGRMEPSTIPGSIQLWMQQQQQQQQQRLQDTSQSHLQIPYMTQESNCEPLYLGTRVRDGQCPDSHSQQWFPHNEYLGSDFQDTDQNGGSSHQY